MRASLKLIAAAALVCLCSASCEKDKGPTDLSGGCDDVKKGYTGNSIFLPAAGYRNGSNLGSVGKGGFYWSSSVYESNLRNTGT